MPLHIRQPVMPSLKLESQLRMIHTQGLHHRRVQVMQVHRILRNVVREIISRAIAHPAPEAPSSHPRRKAARMMIPPIIRLRQRPL